MSFFPISEQLRHELDRPRTDKDVDLAMLTTARIAQTVPEILDAWSGNAEIVLAVGKSPMMQRFHVHRAMTYFLSIVDQEYRVNTMAQRAALNDSVVDDATYMNIVFNSCLKKLREAFDKPAEVLEAERAGTVARVQQDTPAQRA